MSNETSKSLPRTSIGTIKENLDKPVLLRGFVENFRDSKAMAFIVLKDITGKVQVTVEKEKHPELLEELAKVTLDSVITVEGVAVASEYVKLNGLEMIPKEIKIESIAVTSYAQIRNQIVYIVILFVKIDVLE